MNLGFIDGSFVTHNLISTQESPVSLLEFQMAPRLKTLCPLGPRKEHRYVLYFLSKRPGKRTPSRSPTGPLWREIAIYRHYLYIFRNTNKNSSKLELFSLLSKALRKQHPSMFLNSGAPMKTDALFQSLT